MLDNTPVPPRRKDEIGAVDVPDDVDGVRLLILEHELAELAQMAASQQEQIRILCGMVADVVDDD